MSDRLRFGKECEMRNSGSGTVTLVCNDGTKVVLGPGESTTISFEGGRIYRLACAGCGMSDGTHHTWCQLWTPYEAEK